MIRNFGDAPMPPSIFKCNASSFVHLVRSKTSIFDSVMLFASFDVLMPVLGE
jgi:hypothetical protein